MDMGRGEERVRYIMETYITMCKIDSQREFAVWLRKLKQGLSINLEGWDGEGDGREFQNGGLFVYLWLIHVDVDRKQQDSVKQLSFNKKLIKIYLLKWINKLALPIDFKCGVTMPDTCCCCLVSKSCMTLWDPMGSSVHGVSQVRMHSHFLLRGIFPTQGSNIHLVHRLKESFVTEAPGKPAC